MRFVPHCIISRRIERIGLPSNCKLTKCANVDNEFGKLFIELFDKSSRNKLCNNDISFGIFSILLSRKSSIFNCGKVSQKLSGIS